MLAALVRDVDDADDDADACATATRESRASRLHDYNRDASVSRVAVLLILQSSAMSVMRMAAVLVASVTVSVD